MPEAQEGLPSFEEPHAVDKQQKIETKPGDSDIA